MKNQTPIMPCDAARPVRIAFEPDAGKVVVVDVRGSGRTGLEGPHSCRRIPGNASGRSCGRCEPQDNQAVETVVIHRAKSA